MEAQATVENLRTGGEGAFFDSRTRALPAESSEAVDLIAAQIRRVELHPADLVTLLNAMAGRVANTHIAKYRALADEVAYLSLSITDSIEG